MYNNSEYSGDTQSNLFFIGGVFLIIVVRPISIFFLGFTILYFLSRYLIEEHFYYTSNKKFSYHLVYQLKKYFLQASIATGFVTLLQLTITISALFDWNFFEKNLLGLIDEIYIELKTIYLIAIYLLVYITIILLGRYFSFKIFATSLKIKKTVSQIILVVAIVHSLLFFSAINFEIKYLPDYKDIVVYDIRHEVNKNKLYHKELIASDVIKKIQHKIYYIVKSNVIENKYDYYWQKEIITKKITEAIDLSENSKEDGRLTISRSLGKNFTYEEYGDYPYQKLKEYKNKIKEANRDLDIDLKYKYRNYKEIIFIHAFEDLVVNIVPEASPNYIKLITKYVTKSIYQYLVEKINLKKGIGTLTIYFRLNLKEPNLEIQNYILEQKEEYVKIKQEIKRGKISNYNDLELRETKIDKYLSSKIRKDVEVKPIIDQLQAIHYNKQIQDICQKIKYNNNKFYRRIKHRARLRR